ncbi:MAG: thermonuclease family protein [Thermoplasmatota archaeon]
MEEKLYNYKARVIDAFDGSTIRVDIDVGMSIWIRMEPIKLSRIKTPAMIGEEEAKGLKARDFLREKIVGKEILIGTAKDKKSESGRYMGEIWLKDEDDEWININNLMVESGHATFIDKS